MSTDLAWPLQAVFSGYLSGHVPYGLADEIVWRRPVPRFCLDLEHARFPKDVWSRTSGRGWDVRVSTAFDQVVEMCASTPRAESAQWLTPPMVKLYDSLYQADLACSFEVWRSGELIAGEFGILIGGTFFCESKFHTVSGAGNLCTGAAVLTLAASGFSIYDAQYGPSYLRRFSTRGLEPFDRPEFAPAVARAAERRLHHMIAGGTVVLSAPVLPWRPVERKEH